MNYGFFGYSGAMVDRAMRSDNDLMLKECFDAGFVDAETRMLGGETVLEFCDKRGYTKCAAMLRSM